MAGRRERGVRGAVAAVIGLALLLGGDALRAQSPATVPPEVKLTLVATVLQTIVNLSKIIELGVFLFSAYQFWAGRRERLAAEAANTARAKVDANYQAWQVINSAQGKGGSGGRIEALRDLLANGVSLAGIKLDDAWLEGLALPGATLDRASFVGARLANADFAGARLEGADFTGADLMGANFTGAMMRGCNLTGARLSAAQLDQADLAELVGWTEVRSWSHASIREVRRAPAGFTAHAQAAGAVDAANEGVEMEGLDYSRQFRAV